MAAQAWEYAVAYGTDVLAEYGNKGWELVSVVVVDGREKLIFKRPAPSLREQITLSQRAHVLEHKGGEAG